MTDGSAQIQEQTIFDIQEVLREEAQVIGGAELPAERDVPLYQALNARNTAALCLSGGGIRSAAFALGVIQALAAHPRPPRKTETCVGAAESSLLARFHYLSTVSGGGYIGSWLSTWIARTSFADVWDKLVHREPKPEDEPAQIGWLRAYSNYLTPQLGLTSADTWTAVALYLRNLLLNWLIFAPVLCAAILAVKLISLLAFGVSGITTPWMESAHVAVLGAVGLVLQVGALRFALLNRPTRPVRVPAQQRAAAQAEEDTARAANRGDVLEDEQRQAVHRGGEQSDFLWRDLGPAVLAAFCFSMALLSNLMVPVFKLALWKLILLGIATGAAIYVLAWLTAWPWPACEGERNRRYWANDLWLWTVSGGVYGAIVGLGIYVFYTYELALLIGFIELPDNPQFALFMIVYGVPWFFMAQITAEMIFVGLTSWQVDSDADREWFGRSTGWFTAVAISWLAVAFLILVGADLVFTVYSDVNSYFGKATSGVLTAATGVVTAVLGKSSSSPAHGKPDTRGAKWTDLVLMITTPLFLIGLVATFSALLDELLFEAPLLKTTLVDAAAKSTNEDGTVTSPQENWFWLLLALTIALVIATLASKCVNVNRFSLHALYRNRLIRAFLGATNPGRSPNPFTGFDERDNPPMHSLWPVGPADRPFHVINIALNVVSSQRLAWQQRKAEPFTVSPLHCGSAYQAYRRSREYGNRISLGTAMAISGAAASPNMGYHSSPMVTLLLALFNVRLGWWFGNPGKPGDGTYTSEGPLTAVKPLFDEVLGWTTDRNAWVYLSDGGHFENLGLYEMVRRRCRFIVISDAGCDKDFQFEDLGNAVRKIWIDLGIRIHFTGLNALRNRARKNVDYDSNMPPFHAVGTIDYPAADGGASRAGTILYLKPCFHRNRIVNVGVRNYAALNPDFPHEPTADQFFSESQFESYRALGFEMTDSVLNQAFEGFAVTPASTLDEIFARFKTVAGP
jgi:patatin-like phospholipase